MLSAAKTPEWFSWIFLVQDAAQQTLGKVAVSYSAWQRDAITVGAIEYKISRGAAEIKVPWWKLSRCHFGASVLDLNGLVLMRAQTTGTYISAQTTGNIYRIEHGHNQYELKPTRGAWVLDDADGAIGTLVWEPKPMWFRTPIGWPRLRVELPDDLPLVLSLFVVWLLVERAAED